MVVLNWNGWRDTLACLDSLGRLDYAKLETVVVDNGSEDDSVERLRQRFPSIALLETRENLGFPGGCNVGIRHALAQDAEYIWLLNNDAQAAADALRAMVAVAEGSPRVGAVGCVVRDVRASQGIQAWGGGVVNLWTGTNRNVTEPSAAVRLTHLYGASILLRAAALREIGLLDADRYFMFWDENDLCLRLRYAGWDLAVCDTAVVYHEGSASIGKASARKFEYFSRSAVNFFCRHAPFPVVPLLLGSCRSLVKFAVTGRFGLLRATLRGYLQGLGDQARAGKLRCLLRGEEYGARFRGD